MRTDQNKNICLAARETIESTEIFKILKKVSNMWCIRTFSGLFAYC